MSPVCTVIAGPNGAGKTTFALRFLSGTGKSRHFVNADLIAAGLSPLDPDQGQVEAARLFLREIERLIKGQLSFAFETTLSGRGYLRTIQRLTSTGWTVNLIYLWVSDVQECYVRVAERVKHGGHNIPVDVIKRRYSRSIQNLVHEYSAVCSTVLCYDNSDAEPQLIFEQQGPVRRIIDETRFMGLMKSVEQ